ncbi:WbqC family protein [Streptomyces sp. NPDC054786]
MARYPHPSAQGPSDTDQGHGDGRVRPVPAADRPRAPAAPWDQPPLARFPAALGPVLDAFAASVRTAAVTEASTRVTLNLLGWTGQTLRSSGLPARPGRSQRLVDLSAAVGARTHLCGPGGRRYLQPALFTADGITVTAFRTPPTGMWQTGHEVSALRNLMRLGPPALADCLRAVASGPDRVGETPEPLL